MNVSRNQFARDIGVNAKTIYNWERNIFSEGDRALNYLNSPFPTVRLDCVAQFYLKLVHEVKKQNKNATYDDCICAIDNAIARGLTREYLLEELNNNG